MRVGGRLLAVCAAVAWLVVVVPPQARAGGPEFLDQRPILFDIDTAPTGPWRVEVLNATEAETRISLSVVGVPGLAVDTAPEGATAPGATARFVLSFPSPPTAPAQGQLVAVTAKGATARREVKVASGRRTGPVPEVELDGVHLAPLIGPVHIRKAIRDDLSPAGGAPVAARLQGPGGDDAEIVVDRGGAVSVRGVDGAGTYTGTLTVAEGRDAKVTVKVRDSVLWPALVLVVGLALVTALERFVKYLLPARRLAARLERLRASLLDRQRALASVPRVTREPGSSAVLVFDAAVEKAMAEMATAQEAATVDAWGETGTQYATVVDLATRCRTVLDAHARLADDLRRVEARAAALGGVPPLRILHDVRECLGVAALLDKAELNAHTEAVAANARLVELFATALDVLGEIADATTAGEADRAEARQRRATLLTSPGPLEPLATADIAWAGQVAQAASASEAAAAVAAAEVAAEEPVAVPPAEGSVPAALPKLSRAGRRRPRVALPVAALGVVTVLVLVLADRPQLSVRPHTGERTTTTAEPGPTTTVQPEPPPAPTSLALRAPTTREGPPLSPWRRLGWEVGVPVLLAGALYFGARWAVGRWQRWRDGHPRSAAAAAAAEERGFGGLSLLLTVLSGLSVLYLPDATFGGADDYLKALLWGTAVGEGVQVARRLALRFDRLG